MSESRSIKGRRTWDQVEKNAAPETGIRVWGWDTGEVFVMYQGREVALQEYPELLANIKRQIRQYLDEHAK